MRIPLLSLTLLLTSITLTGQSLKLVNSETYDISVYAKNDGELTLRTTGGDPQVVFELQGTDAADKEAYFLAFDYFCPDGVDFVEVFYAADRPYHWSQSRQLEGGSLPKAEAWQPYSIDLKLGSKDKWTANDQYIRIDFGRSTGKELQIRNLRLRAPTAEELLSSEEAEAKLLAKSENAAKLDHYLTFTRTPAKVTKVSVSEEAIHITGVISQEINGDLRLVEYEPHEDPWAMNGGKILPTPSLTHKFSVTVPRYVGERDRLANRYAIVREVDGLTQLICRATWANDVSGAAERDMPRLYPANKKGLGGVELKPGIFEQDLSDLGITASTVNFSLGTILQKTSNPIDYTHQGKTYTYNGDAMKEFDQKISWMTENGIVVSAILLVDKDAGALVHPDYNTAGIYSMANMTDQVATDAYRAIVSFLAERYSRPDREHGWITHWIVFNEVDYGWIWTNMGETPMELYMDAYNKAMRLTWLETRRFNPTAEVFISLTHHWQYSPADKYRAYPPRKILDRMALYSSSEGDYQWGIAYHPYPQSLLKPRTWEDSMATASFDTRFITPKNIEVLDAYLHQPQFLHQDKVRTVILSEQGFHTPDYSETSLQNKAAAIAYTWEKILPLESIESFHYHRWVDHPMEGGLKVGLRTLPSDKHPHGIRKEPAFSVFSALETDQHIDVIDCYKSIIGISDWDEVRIAPETISTHIEQ